MTVWLPNLDSRFWGFECFDRLLPFKLDYRDFVAELTVGAFPLA